MEYDPTIEDNYSYYDEDYDRLGPPQALTTKVTKGSTSSTYHIPRAATIESDNKPHKVTIGILRLPSEFSYKAIPKLSTFAFLHSATTNTSEFQLVPGQAKIFLDNNFVADSTLKSVSPGETFSLFLGSDAGIKIDYKSPEKFKEQAGLINKVDLNISEYLTIIKNTKPIPVCLSISDQLPKSDDEKVKVKLLLPERVGEGVKIQPVDSIITWTLNIPPGEEVRVPFKYSVESPQQKTVSYYEAELER
eukprot:TRINITY_DN2050_c0_g2_i5.p1 TRINITY_DN2050_c0_g2~~TRINITY_DN2050_c0_g2_i5.p1  ORF type:complete len:248 (-),score=49.65 TRINITY_DN2050_c0_g2_i5:74-817(-)